MSELKESPTYTYFISKQTMELLSENEQNTVDDKPIKEVTKLINNKCQRYTVQTNDNTMYYFYGAISDNSDADEIVYYYGLTKISIINENINVDIKRIKEISALYLKVKNMNHI